MEVEPTLSNVLEFEIEEAKIQKVTVFNDRVELSRKLTVNLPSGQVEIRIKNPSSSFDSDTLRIDTSSEFLIHEVQLKKAPFLQKDVESPKATALRKIYEEKILQHRESQFKEQILQRRIESLNCLMTSFSKDSLNVLEDGVFDKIGKLHEFYEVESHQLRKKHAIAADLVREAQNKMVKAEKELNSITSDYDIAKRGVKSMKIIAIFLKSSGGNLNLNLTYQNLGAGWLPSYDFRVNTASSPPSLEIRYFGKVHQKTGEDWKNMPLLLSTANTRGTVRFPTLRTVEVGIANKRDQWANTRRRSRSRDRKARRNASRSRSRSSSGDGANHSVAEEVEEKVLSTEFKIGNLSNITGNGDEHKVTIGVFKVEPILYFQCAPKQDPSAYLTAYICNTSQLPMLAGMASIFLNNSFITQTSIKHISRGEKFMVPLGIDPSIKVTNLPTKTYKAESGVLLKSNCTAYGKQFEVKNNKKEAITLTLKEAIPRSTENKIKIDLRQPKGAIVELPSETPTNPGEVPSEGAVLKNLSSILEWTIVLQPGEKRNLLVEYTIEHPQNEKIYFSTI